MASRALLQGWTTCTDGLSVVFLPAICVQGRAARRLLTAQTCTATAAKGTFELAAPPAVASGKRLVNQQPDERRSSPSPRHTGPLGSGWTTTSSRSCGPLGRRMHAHRTQARRSMRAHNLPSSQLSCLPTRLFLRHLAIEKLGWESRYSLWVRASTEFC